ncbi:MAG: flavodoxin-dependent (E)-4-hydroxy-3-methylbut-2-enyl-diphosphate synthase [Coriobacteriia bacterium]|nr:flavodoxin-dependent (E)-4-hydroxy-3-methylbut-2-enyl-diphosphate synthase [Coriobacteriia bacterium]
MLAREATRQVMVGKVAVGGGAPVVVQSMCSTDTQDTQQTLAQIHELAEAGCELIRVALPSKAALNSFEEICKKSPLPVIADIHFSSTLALAAADLGASALRINPGNIGSMDKVDEIIEKAKEKDIPIRIGVNAGSLDPYYREQGGWLLPDKLVASSKAVVEHFELNGFYNIVLSAKAHDVLSTLETYERLSHDLPKIPLHLGVTEAGTFRQGTVKSSIGIGKLLLDGIGDTFRVSLTADPIEEIKVAWDILSSIGLRRRFPELVSCPTCGRCKVNLVQIAQDVEARLAKLALPISVAVMGCVVNGPGEARDADIGVAAGDGIGTIFVQGEVVKKVPESHIIDALFEEIALRFPLADDK